MRKEKISSNHIGFVQSIKQKEILDGNKKFQLKKVSKEQLNGIKNISGYDIGKSDWHTWNNSYSLSLLVTFRE